MQMYLEDRCVDGQSSPLLRTMSSVGLIGSVSLGPILITWCCLRQVIFIFFGLS